MIEIINTRTIMVATGLGAGKQTLKESL